MKGNIYSSAKSQSEAVDFASTKSQLKVLSDSITAGVSGVKTYVQSRGENLITNGNGLIGDNTNFTSFTFDATQSYAGGGSFYSNAQNATRLNDELIPVNPTNEYRFSLMAKTKTGLGKYYFMASCYDIDSLSISPFMTYGSTRPIVQLAADLKAGDTTITLTSVDGFIDNAFAESDAHKHSIVFWGYKNSKGYTYPDGTYSRLYRSGMWNDGGINRTTKVITLNKAWNYPNPYDPEGIWRTGQNVSATQSGGSYKYFAGSNVFVPTTWTKQEGTISGIGMNDNQFMPGTAYVLLGGLLNRSSGGGTAGDEIWLNSLEFYNTTSETKAKEYSDAQLKITKDAINLSVAKSTGGVRVRYIRDWLNGSSANANSHWVQVQAFKDGTNVAAGKPVTASGSASGGYPLTNVTNGNLSTGNYAAIDAAGLNWVQVDLGSVVADIDYLMVYHYFGDGRTYNGTKTEVSEDGVTWFPVYDSEASGKYQETSSGMKFYVNPNHALSSAESSIKVSSGKIALVVTSDNKVNGTNLVSAINQTAEGVTIDGTKVNINGSVTFGSLSDKMKKDLTTEENVFNTNSSFLEYPTSPGYPTGYVAQTGAAPTKVISDSLSGTGVQQNIAAGANTYFAQDMYQPYYEFVTVTATFKLTSGSIDGAGILFRLNKSGGILQDHKLYFKDANNPITLNKWYTVSKTFRSSTATGFTAYTLFVMAGWTGFETITAKNIIFDSVTARPATQTEKDAFTSEGSVAGWRMPNKTTINGGSIETNTITATQIDTGTITANEIAGTTITAAKIATGTLTATQMAANSITANKLILGDTTNYVTTTETDPKTAHSAFSGVTITGGYVKKTATSNQFFMLCDFTSNPFKQNDELFFSLKAKAAAATTVNMFVWYYDINKNNTSSEQIGSLALTTADKLFTGSAKLLSGLATTASYVLIGFDCLNVDMSVKEASLRKKNTGDLIVDGAITANKIAVNAVRAENLFIGDLTNMMQYDEMSYPGPYNVITNTDSLKYFKIGQGAYSTFQMARSERVEFKIGDSYYVSFNGFRESAITGNINFIIRYYYSDGSFNNAGVTPLTYPTTVSSIEGVAKIISAPDPAKKVARVDFFLEKDATTTGYYHVRNLELRKMMSGKMIVDGTIDAGKVRIVTSGSSNNVVIDQFGITATRGDQKVFMNSTDGFAIKNGSTNMFTVGTNGVVTAENFVMNSGAVPGGAVNSGVIDASKVTVSGGGGSVVLNGSGLTATRGTVTAVMNATEGFAIKNSGTATFSVDTVGTITANKMNLIGSSTINVGGGVVINSTGLTATGTIGGSSVVTSMNSADGFKIAVGGTTKFSVGSDGNIKAAGLSVTGGAMTGGSISGTSIEGSTLYLAKTTYYPNSDTLNREISVRIDPLTIDQFAYDIEIINLQSYIPQQSGDPIVQNLIFGFDYFTPLIESRAFTGLKIKSSGSLDMSATGFSMTGGAINMLATNGAFDVKTTSSGKVTLKSEGVNTSYIEIDSNGSTNKINNVPDNKGYIVLTAPDVIKAKPSFGNIWMYSNTNVTAANNKEAVIALFPDDDTTSGIQIFGRKDSVGIYDRKNGATFIRYSASNDLTFYAKNTTEFFVHDADLSTNISVLKFDGTKDDAGVWIDLGGGSRTIITAGESNISPENHLGFGPATESLLLEANGRMYFAWDTNSGFSRTSTPAQFETNSYGVTGDGELFRPIRHDRMHLGGTSFRWKTVWAVNASINSDSRSKHDIQYIQGSNWNESGFIERLAGEKLPASRAGEVYDFMKQMPLYQFKYDGLKSNEHQHQFGFMADQLLQYDKHGVADFFIGIPEKKEDMLSVSTQSYAAAIHMTLQQEIERNDKLEKEVKSLRRLVTKIQKQLKEGA